MYVVIVATIVYSSSVVTGAALKIGDLVTGRSSDCTGIGVGVTVPKEETDNPEKVCST